MRQDARRQKLESFGRAPALLCAALRQFPKKMWTYKPATDRWSIHEIILHLADSEANAYVRCRACIAEPAAADSMRFNASRWALSLGYFHQSTHEALEIIRRLRKMTYQLLMALPEEVWEHRIAHPRDGSITLARWVDLQERHIPHHLLQIRENFEQWLQTHPPRRRPAPPLAPQNSPHMLSVPAGIR
ncbi:MAG: DinB family protein [Candidatus Acidiferrales bacterium]